MLAPWKKSYDKPRHHIKKQRHYFADKGPYNQSYGFSSSHVWIWALDHKKRWAPNNWCFQIVLEKTRESLGLQGDEFSQSWRKSVLSIHWKDCSLMLKLQYFLPDTKSQLIGEAPDAGKDCRQKEKAVAEDEMVTEHHWLTGHDFEQTLGDSGGQRSLTCWSPWGHKESDTT